MKIEKKITIRLVGAASLAGIYSIMRAVAKRRSESEDIDEGNPYIDPPDYGRQGGDENRNFQTAAGSRAEVGIYENTVKPAFDKVISFGGLVILSPLFGMISLAVWLDDPGPVLFTQKRVGKDKHYIMIHKFRSMKMSTPHDVPTHQLSDPDQYITRVGRMLRKMSLDELPQIWDIFRGRMSVIGPRPALWNQGDLVEARVTAVDGIDANTVLPGLTGLAQIKGRDELEILDKARLDAEYVEKLREGGLKAFFFDCKMFFGTIVSVLKHDGVIEGGTGSLSNTSDDPQMERPREIKPIKTEDVGFEDYGCYKHFNIDKDRHVNILITGAESYIGESFKFYCESHYPNIEITTIDMVDGSWRQHSYKDETGKPYDAVFHIAGIAHADVGKTSAAEQMKYYEVNTDLAIECARKSREVGVKQFIFISSMIVYGRAERVDEYTIPQPANFYGNSKWLADKGVRELGTADFKVAVLRSPMIYGRGSKGNYPILSRIAKMTLVFPRIRNKRSMLYIENLCEFVAQLSLSGCGGVYFPQNAEYSSTSELVKVIGEVVGSKVRLSRTLALAVEIAKYAPIKKIRGFVEKAFGSSWYEQGLSQYEGLEYQKVTLEESINRTEG